ncbi:MAG: Ig-like domain-containing protein [Coprococcus sp.]
MKKYLTLFLSCLFIFFIFAFNTTVSRAATVNSSATLSSEDDSSENADEPIHILFVGNSFTSSNGFNIGTILEDIAASQGKNIDAESINHGSAYLSYYASPTSKYASYYKELHLALLTDSWDYIVLQEQSKGGIENSNNMYTAIEQLKKLINIYQPDAEILLYMTHGYADGTTTSVNGQDILLSASQLQQYTQAAYKYIGDKLELRTIPVGVAFSRISQNYADINLLLSDNKHPNYTGFYLAASCFYKAIFNEVPTDINAIPQNCILDEETRCILYNAADGLLSLDICSHIMKPGQAYQLKADITEKDEKITWKSLKPSVVSVSDTGELTAKKTGNALIIAQTDSGLQDVCYISVEDETLYDNGLMFSTSYYVVEPGDKIKVTPYVSASLSDNNIKWSLSGKTTASITSDGTVTALAPGRSIIKVSDIISGKSASYTLYVRLSAPKKISAKTITASSNKANEADIKISWSSVNNATSYTIYRSTSKNGTYIAIGNTSSRSYIDKKISTAKSYYYKVTASNSYTYCESEKSSVYARVIAPTTPVITKTAATNTRISIRWTRKTSASGYIIYRSTNNGKTYKEVARITSNTKITYIDRNVKTGKSYCYKIKSYRNLGDKTYNSNYSPYIKIKAEKKSTKKTSTQ